MNLDGDEPLGAILTGALTTIKLRLRLQGFQQLLLLQFLMLIMKKDGDVTIGVKEVGAVQDSMFK